MEMWIIALICFAIAFGSVLFTEIFKQIVKFIFKKKGKEINMKKAEYPIAFSSIAICFGAIFAFLYFGKWTEMSLEDIIKLSSIFASGSQVIYMFLIQAPRKGFTWFVNSIKKLTNKIKNGENIDSIIEDMKDNNELDESNKKIDIDEEIRKFKENL